LVNIVKVEHIYDAEDVGNAHITCMIKNVRPAVSDLAPNYGTTLGLEKKNKLKGITLTTNLSI